LLAALECGSLLAEAKAALPHGEWQDWLSEHCPAIGQSTARMYMQLHHHRDKITQSSDPIETIADARALIVETKTLTHSVLTDDEPENKMTTALESASTLDVEDDEPDEQQVPKDAESKRSQVDSILEIIAPGMTAKIDVFNEVKGMLDQVNRMERPIAVAIQIFYSSGETHCDKREIQAKPGYTISAEELDDEEPYFDKREFKRRMANRAKRIGGAS